MKLHREIKFRGVKVHPEIEDQDEWIYGYLSIEEDAVYIQEENCRFAHEVWACSLGQFTGFYDKNGTEIYENDVLVCEGKSFKYVVHYNLGCFEVIPNGLPRYSTPLKYHVTSNDNQLELLEVIGNLFTTPPF